MTTPRLERPLADAEWDLLGELLAKYDAGVDIEGMDGIIAACACGPRELPPAEVLRVAFDDANLPAFESAEDAERFMSLCLRRHNDFVHFLELAGEELTEDDIPPPMLLDVAPAEAEVAANWVAPRNDPEAVRPGDWPGQQWARGFLRVYAEFQDEWSALDADEDALFALAPAFMLDHGFNPDRPDEPLDADRWIDLLLPMLRELATFFRADALRPRDPYRAPPKVGRNDPCPCGSGKKFKKCCGAVA